MTTSPAKVEGRLARTLRMATSRPHLALGAVVGVLAWAALALVPEFRWSTRSILAWDAGVFTFVIGMMKHMANKDPDAIRATSARQDEGQGLILTLVLNGMNLLGVKTFWQAGVLGGIILLSVLADQLVGRRISRRTA